MHKIAIIDNKIAIIEYFSLYDSSILLLYLITSTQQNACLTRSQQTLIKCQNTMRTNNTITTNENASVLDMTMLTTYVMREHFKEQYNFFIDSDSIDNDYIHVLRNDTNVQTNKAHNHAFHMYFKHKKQQVNVLCNKANFDAFESEYRVKDKKTNCKYIVDYAHIIDFMIDIMTYDTNRQTTSATKEVQAIAK